MTRITIDDMRPGEQPCSCSGYGRRQKPAGRTGAAV